MKNAIITEFEKKFFKKKKMPAFSPGDTVNVHYRVFDVGGEGKKARIQQFEGVVIAFKKGTAESTFTVRKISAGGIGVERLFPLNSPNIEKLEVRAKGAVRRARLYYLRNLSGKSARIRSRFMEGEEVDTTATNEQANLMAQVSKEKPVKAVEDTTSETATEAKPAAAKPAKKKE
jgi:large subunit ribosomal protein L19